MRYLRLCSGRCWRGKSILLTRLLLEARRLRYLLLRLKSGWLRLLEASELWLLLLLLLELVRRLLRRIASYLRL